MSPQRCSEISSVTLSSDVAPASMNPFFSCLYQACLVHVHFLAGREINSNNPFCHCHLLVLSVLICHALGSLMRKDFLYSSADGEGEVLY